MSYYYEILGPKPTNKKLLEYYFAEWKTKGEEALGDLYIAMLKVALDNKDDTAKTILKWWNKEDREDALLCLAHRMESDYYYEEGLKYL